MKGFISVAVKDDSDVLSTALVNINEISTIVKQKKYGRTVHLLIKMVNGQTLTCLESFENLGAKIIEAQRDPMEAVEKLEEDEVPT